jgi:hypothetical protein
MDLKTVTFSVGDKVHCNGIYPSTVYRVLEGQLTGMLEVRVPGGLVCVSASEVAYFTKVHESAQALNAVGVESQRNWQLLKVNVGAYYAFQEDGGWRCADTDSMYLHDRESYGDWVGSHSVKLPAWWQPSQQYTWRTTEEPPEQTMMRCIHESNDKARCFDCGMPVEEIAARAQRGEQLPYDGPRLADRVSVDYDTGQEVILNVIDLIPSIPGI